MKNNKDTKTYKVTQKYQENTSKKIDEETFTHKWESNYNCCHTSLLC